MDNILNKDVDAFFANPSKKRLQLILDQSKDLEESDRENLPDLDGYVSSQVTTRSKKKKQDKDLPPKKSKNKREEKMAGKKGLVQEEIGHKHYHCFLPNK